MSSARRVILRATRAKRPIAFLAAVVLIVPVSLVASLLYARHLHSDAYRRGVEELLSERMGLSVSIGQVRPLTLHSKSLTDVRVAMVDPDLDIFTCAEAVWRGSTRNGRRGYVLDLNDGWLLLGTSGWTRAEYLRMLAGGFGHDFSALGIEEVRLKNFSLRFEYPLAEVLIGGASGTIIFDDNGTGQASITCTSLNGYAVDRPVAISARFTPGEQLVFHDVNLRVPRIPLSAMAVHAWLGQAPSHGEFEGTIRYGQGADGAEVSVAGLLHEVDLFEVTSGVAGGPYHGMVDVDVEAAEFLGRRLVALIGRGRIGGLRIGELFPRLADPGDAARFDLDVDQVRWDGGRVAYLSARGRCDQLSLDALSSIWQLGTITGNMSIDIRSLLVVDDKLKSLDVVLESVAPKDGPATIDRTLLAYAAKAWLGVDVSMALPKRVKYRRLGAHLVVEGDRLRVLGTHGPEGKTILTIALFGREWGVIKQPGRTFGLPDVIELLRRQADDVESSDVRDWWDSLRQTPGPEDTPLP